MRDTPAEREEPRERATKLAQGYLNYPQSVMLRDAIVALFDDLLAQQEAPSGPYTIQVIPDASVSRVLDEVEALADNWHPGFTPMEASRETVREIRRRLAAARPAPETREPELLGYVVERQLTPGEWVRVWRGSTLWFDHDEAVLDRDAYALDGIPARIRPVYLGAPAPERGLASATSEEGAGDAE